MPAKESPVLVGVVLLCAISLAAVRVYSLVAEVDMVVVLAGQLASVQFDVHLWLNDVNKREKKREKLQQLHQI